MSCIVYNSVNGTTTFYNNYLYNYACNGEIINNICQSKCIELVNINNLIILIVLSLFLFGIIVFTILCIIKPEIFCCKCGLCWKSDDNFDMIINEDDYNVREYRVV